MKDAGTAKISAIAVHWHVSKPTARRILLAAGVLPVATGPKKYRWQDIWRLEGEVYVPPADWASFKAPLLTVAELPGLDPEERKARTWRRYVEKDRLPVIRLSEDIARIRKSIFLIARHYV
ncbi:MAG: hypothetical protein EP320_10475 [Rhodobacteraceae bacterium]|nr:MAG: hypothetical protein EP320_10475 [Paracoccaceae bacterium]